MATGRRSFQYHRQVKYLNNRLEGDHGKLKRLIKPTTQRCTVGRSATRRRTEGALFINRLFGIYA